MTGWGRREKILDLETSIVAPLSLVAQICN